MAREADTGKRLLTRARAASTRVRRARPSRPNLSQSRGIVTPRIQQLLSGITAPAAAAVETGKAVATKIAPAAKSLGRRALGIGGFLAPIIAPIAIGALVRGRREVKASRELSRTLVDPEARAARIQREVFLRTLKERLLASKLARMQRVAGNDPALFKMLAASVAGSARPRTNSRTVRIGRDPSQAEMISSGLFG